MENANTGQVNFINAGAFVRVYNQSFFILTERFGKKLASIKRNIKSVNNQFVIMGGFPTINVKAFYPLAVETDWGYQLTTNYGLTGYDVWLEWQQLKAATN